MGMVRRDTVVDPNPQRAPLSRGGGKNVTATESDSGSASSNSVVFALNRADIAIISVGCVAIGVALGVFLPAIGGEKSDRRRTPAPRGRAIAP